MKRLCLLSYMLLMLCLLSCHSPQQVNERKEKQALSTELYANPVLRISAPDPTVIRAEDGSFYLYSTEDIRHMPIFKSENMVDWKEIGTVFTDQTRPNFVIASNGERKSSLWAPEIRFIKGKYVLFYSLAVWGDLWISTIGYAVADRPEGPFEERGKLFNSREVNVKNSIDQFFYEEDGHYYMLWGSFFGLYIMELKISDDLKITPIYSTIRPIAGTAYEGVNLWKRNGYYYLFASVGTCCEEERSTYTTVVGRSRSLFGPYVDRNGESMMKNAHEIVLHGNEEFAGTGHNAVLIEDDLQHTWMYYHAYQRSQIGRHRQVLLDRVLWDSERWPYLKGNQPSLSAHAPFIQAKKK